MIGVFDSGFGGLTVLKHFLDEAPEYSYMYLGDNARAPYGNRSAESVYECARQGVRYLFEQGAELVILACNTASALALRHLQQEWLPKEYPHRRVLGVLIPLVETALKETRTGRVGVAGTRGTIESGALEREFERRGALSVRGASVPIQLFLQSCPLLVPLIEEGWMHKSETRRILRSYLRPLKRARIDTLLLACTHYPLLYKEFCAVMGRRVRVIDNRSVAHALKDYFVRHSDIAERCKGSGAPSRIFATTDDPMRFSRMGSRFLGRAVEARHAVLECV